MIEIKAYGNEYTCNAPSGKIAIFDYDGTLSDGSHRLHLLPKNDLHLTESWREFNLAAQFDTPITDTIAVMNAMYAAGICVIILTGRSDEVKAESIAWLRRYNAMYDFIIMRKHDDNRKDTVIKEEILNEIGLERIIACWDDSPTVIPHLRGMGLTVYAVTDYGDNVHSHLKSHGVDKLENK